MRITGVINTDLEDIDSDDLLDLYIELLFLLMVLCSVLGALLSVITTGNIEFQAATVYIFIFVISCFLIFS